MLRFWAGLILAASPAAIPASPPPAPSGKWVVDYAKDYCVLSRDGTGSEPGIGFRTRPLAERHDVLLYLPPTGAPGASKKGRVAAGEGEMGPQRNVEEIEPKDKKYRFINTMVSQDEFDAVAKSGSLRLSVENGPDLRVSLPRIAKAMEALRTCEDDLARRWGLNVAYLRNWKTAPQPKVQWQEITKKRDWPDWNRNWGVNKASFTVDETGKATECTVAVSSGSKRMDKALCDAILQMPFTPALDAAGQPVRSAQMFGMYWALHWETRYEFWPR